MAAHTVLVCFYQNVFCGRPYPLRAEVISIAWLLCSQLLQLSPWVLLNSHTLYFCHQLMFTYQPEKEQQEREFQSWEEVQKGKRLFRLSSCPTDHRSVSRVSTLVNNSQNNAWLLTLRARGWKQVFVGFDVWLGCWGVGVVWGVWFFCLSVCFWGGLNEALRGNKLSG